MSEIDHLDKIRIDSLEEAAKAVPHLANTRTLVLNTDGNPADPKFEPWTKIMFWLVKGWQREKEGKTPIIVPLEYYNDVEVRTSTKVIRVPSVVMLTEYQNISDRPVKVSRYNVYLRDNFTCQYTGLKLPEGRLTLDHVVPQSKGGRSTWDNLVTCDAEVNYLKANMSLKEFEKKFPQYHLRRMPYEPSIFELRQKERKYPPKYLHESWHDYLYYDSEIEP